MSTPIAQMCVPVDGTLRDVLMALETGGAQIALVVDAAMSLKGVMTDGDVRRALLMGASLDDLLIGFIKKETLTVGLGSSRAEAIDIMQAMRIDQLPVVDSDGKVCAVHLLHELLGAVDRPNWAVIMAGGRGSRLGELTKSLPKPMLKVAGRPILERLVLHLMGFGVHRIFLAVNYLSDLIEGHFGDGSQFGCQIEYLREKEPLGTGGALSLLPEIPAHPIIVCNGDLVTQVNLEDMLLFHGDEKFGMTVGLYDYTHQIPYGCVEVDNDRITALVEKPTIIRPINAGLYVINPTLIQMVPREFFPITELIDACIARSIPVGAWTINDDWIDVGHKESLMLARNGAQ